VSRIGRGKNGCKDGWRKGLVGAFLVEMILLHKRHVGRSRILHVL
jgi:hypothetical protein